MKLYPYLAVATMGLSMTATAQTERDLDSHEHGAAAMNVALEESTILIELESPWNNLVGFEHAPSTDEQHALVDEALAMLEQPMELFTFKSAECIVAEMAVENSMSDSDDHDEHHDDEHADEKHDEHHDDEHADEKHDEHHDDEHDHEESTHSEVRASYSFSCSDMSNLSSIDVELLTQWTNIEDLDVQMIGPGGQSSAELNPQQISLDLKAIR